MSSPATATQPSTTTAHGVNWIAGSSPGFSEPASGIFRSDAEPVYDDDVVIGKKQTGGMQ